MPSCCSFPLRQSRLLPAPRRCPGHVTGPRAAPSPRHALLRPEVRTSAVAGGPKPLPYQTPQSPVFQQDSCSTSYVTVDNQAHDKYTVIDIDARDYPGLLRIISWTLNGMGVRVAHAVCTTVAVAESADSKVARDKFWITDVRGRKLSDHSAQSLAERLEDFVMFCAPEAADRQLWRAGPLEISNAAHPQYTQLIIRGEPSNSKPGYLLELTSVLSSIGAIIHEAVIQSSPDFPVPDPCGCLAEPDYDFKAGRFFRFWLTDLNGEKMDESRISAIIFALNLIGGQGHMPIVAPNMESLLNRMT